MNNAFPSREMRDCEIAHSFCFWKPYKHTRKMAKVLSFETIPHFYWKNDKGVKPANGIQPAFCGDFIVSRATSIDSECCRLPTTSVLSKKNGKMTLQPVLIDKSKFLKATRYTEIMKIEIPRSIVVEALSW